MDDSRKDEPSEILNRHAAADLRGLALTERRYGDCTPNDEVSAAVGPTVYRDGDLAAAAERWLILHAGRFHRAEPRPKLVEMVTAATLVVMMLATVAIATG